MMAYEGEAKGGGVRSQCVRSNQGNQTQCANRGKPRGEARDEVFSREMQPSTVPPQGSTTKCHSTKAKYGESI